MHSDAPPAFERLYGIVRRLRGPNGCPWDREQTPRTLRASLIEEAWEAVSAIDSGDDANLGEELGDLFLLLTMISWMKEEQGSFTLQSVLQGISDKLVRRHPHVFGSATAGSSQEVLAQWEAIKAGERGAAARETSPSALDHVPGSLPPLEKSLKLQKKAAKVGFDWPGPEQVWEKIEEELCELRDAVDRRDAAAMEAETGDVLFSLINLSRLLRVDPAVALNRTNVKFDRRFREVERRLAGEGVATSEAGLERMDALWNAVKKEEPIPGRPVQDLDSPG